MSQQVDDVQFSVEWFDAWKDPGKIIESIIHGKRLAIAVRRLLGENERLQKTLGEERSGADLAAAWDSKKMAVLESQVDALREVLSELREAVKAEPAMNHRKYDALGIRVNMALGIIPKTSMCKAKEHADPDHDHCSARPSSNEREQQCCSTYFMEGEHALYCCLRGNPPADAERS